MLNWRKLGDIGIKHCMDSHDVKTLRFVNYVAFFGIIVITIYSLVSLFQFHFRHLGLFSLEMSFVVVLAAIPLLNSRGWLKTSKVIGILFCIAYVMLLNIASGNILGGAYTLLVTSILPMILFRERWLYTGFFCLFVAAFFSVYYYFLNYPPLVDFAAAEKNTVYITATLMMFVLLYFLMQYFIQANRSFELEITTSKQLIESKNRDILDSINYAKRIQSAILPPARAVKEELKNAFVLYLPKDIVAGDYYWIEKIGDTVYFAACDCTGHGVPGALVSMLCNNALSRALNEYEERRPGKILDRTRELIVEKFSGSDEDVKDGMDASLAALKLNESKLLWAGANIPLWIYRSDKSEIEEIRGDKQPIGKVQNEQPFTTHEIELKSGDVVYLFTDGYADQFGGDKIKKLTRSGFRAFLLTIAHLSPDEQREKLLNFHHEYRRDQEQIDDICIIGVRI